MIEGKGTKDFAKTKFVAYEDPAFFGSLIELLTEKVSEYVIQQIENGVEVIKIFDSWASALPNEMVDNYCIQPISKIVSNINKKFPDFPIIAFPKGINRLVDFVKSTKISAVAIDSHTSIEWARKNLSPYCIVQGNLDPSCLRAGGDQMMKQAKFILDTMQGEKFIFNLGHGVQKETDPDNVGSLVNFIQSYS